MGFATGAAALGTGDENGCQLLFGLFDKSRPGWIETGEVPMRADPFSFLKGPR